MPQKDLYYIPMREALTNDGWTVTHEDYVIQYKGKQVYADLAAEKLLVAEKNTRKIIVEIKVFNTPSPMTELERAIGQYGIYRTFLKRVSNCVACQVRTAMKQEKVGVAKAVYHVKWH